MVAQSTRVTSVVEYLGRSLQEGEAQAGASYVDEHLPRLRRTALTTSGTLEDRSALLRAQAVQISLMHFLQAGASCPPRAAYRVDQSRTFCLEKAAVADVGLSRTMSTWWSLTPMMLSARRPGRRGAR